MIIKLNSSMDLSKLSTVSKINRRFYIIKKRDLTTDEIEYIKKKLTFIPKVHRDYNKFVVDI